MDGTFKITGLPHGPVEISAIFCDACKSFEFDRIEYPGGARADQAPGDGGVAGSSPWPDQARMLLNGEHLIQVDRNMKGIRVLVRYKAFGSIRSHVNVIGELSASVRLVVYCYYNTASGSSVMAMKEVDADGDTAPVLLEPGTYDVELSDARRTFSETRRVTIVKDREVKVLFTIDASKVRQ